MKTRATIIYAFKTKRNKLNHCRLVVGESRMKWPNRYSDTKRRHMPFGCRMGFGCVSRCLCCRCPNYAPKASPAKAAFGPGRPQAAGRSAGFPKRFHESDLISGLPGLSSRIWRGHPP
jgi:hypothetical protein